MQGEDSPLAMSHDTKAMDSAEIVGFKDGVKVTPSTSTTGGKDVVLSIKCPSLGDSSIESTLITVPLHCTIGQVKQRIELTWPGRPQPQGMRIFKAGRLLSDDVIVGDIVPPCDRSEPAAIHLVIRSTAWSEPRPTLAKRHSSTRAPRRQPSPHPAWVPAGSSIPASEELPRSSLLPLPTISFPKRGSSRSERMTPQDAHLANIIENMEPSNYSSFRSLLTWSYYQHVDMYEQMWKEMYGQWSKEAGISEQDNTRSVEELAKEMSCSEEEIISAVKLVESEALQWPSLAAELEQSSKADESAMTYKSVTLQGLPYLLQVKRDPRSGPLAVLLGRIRKLQDLVHRMDKLISYQTLFEQASNTSALQADMRSRQSAMLAAATAAGNAAGIPGGAAAAPNAPRARVYRVRLEFNAYNILNVAVPAFLLSFKVTLLVYVFTRGASTFKTCLIAGAGAAFVLLEAWKTAQRQNRNRAQAAQPANPATRQGDTSAADAGREQAAEEDGFDSLRPRAPIRRRALSPLAIDYWIESLAYIGLESEERQFGWHPLPTAASRPQQRSYLAKIFQDQILLPLLLMFVTLIPEIEQKRRRAIDQRDDLIRSTAEKVEGRKARLAEKAKENRDTKDEKSLNMTPLTNSIEEVPSYLQHSYCQRVIHNRRTGRQIDIAQELEAAAAADDGAANQADMGFL